MKANQSIKNNTQGAMFVPIAIAVVVVFALLFIGAYVNGEIRTSLEDSYPAAHSRTTLENETLSTQDNLSENFDDSIDIVQVVIIITLLAAAIGAIFLFTRYT